uniref:C2H2-type domain-containing protein n=1 Tax=Anopheles atroparvus TaxID=41427 RepID=A0A182J142_ANOAO
MAIGQHKTEAIECGGDNATDHATTKGGGGGGMRRKKVRFGLSGEIPPAGTMASSAHAHTHTQPGQKKHKRKRLSAVLDKLHNGGTVVNHNNNNVGEGHGFKVKCSDSRSSAEDSAEDSVFPYSASPRISVSPLRLSEVDENVPHQTHERVQLQPQPQQQMLGLDQQLPSPSQQHQAKLNALQQAMVPLQQASQNKQQDPQNTLLHNSTSCLYFNPLALFNYLPEPTKLLYQEFARQRSHSDSDLQQQQQQQQQQLEQQQKLDQRSLQSQSQHVPKKKRSNNGNGAGVGGGRASQKRASQTASRRNSNASSSGSSVPLDPQEHPLDLSMKSTGSGRPSLHAESPTLLTTVIKEEPKLDESPPPPALPGSPLPPGMIVKREHFPDLRQSPAYEHHLNGGMSLVPSVTGPGGFNLNVSPVVEAMPPGSDVAYMCPVCGQLFSLQDRLAKHMASRHKSRTGATDITKSYMCEVCHRSFARSDMLTRHMRLHTGVKPYSCKVCGQIFSRSDHLSTHQRTHTGEKPYKCPQCPYAACRRDMITRHMRTHTRHELQRVGGGGGGGGGGSSGGSTSPLMDQKSLLLPLVNLSTGRGMMKEAAFGGVNSSFALEATTES